MPFITLQLFAPFLSACPCTVQSPNHQQNIVKVGTVAGHVASQLPARSISHSGTASVTEMLAILPSVRYLGGQMQQLQLLLLIGHFPEEKLASQLMFINSFSLLQEATNAASNTIKIDAYMNILFLFHAIPVLASRLNSYIYIAIWGTVCPHADVELQKLQHHIGQPQSLNKLYVHLCYTYSYIKTHGRVSAAKEVMWHQDTRSCVSGQGSHVAHKCLIYRNR